MNPPVVKSGLHVYEVRPREDHRNVGFRCAAVWSVVVAKVTGAIGYARHQSRSRDALIRQDSMRYKNFVVFTALALPALTHLSAVAQTCPDNVPHITGTWTVLPYQMPINPISANLLPNGKVLIVAGSESDPYNHSPGAESYRAAVWDPSGTDESSISVQNLTYDVFCSGTAALFDGRSLIVGGTSKAADYTNSQGENRASIFNPVTNQYVQCQNMVDGRWYATATELADGRIMAMSGLTQTGPTSRTIEIYDLQLAGAGWNPPTSVPFTPPLFPRLELLPGGRVFYTGHGSGASTANAWIFDPATGGWTQSATTTRNRQVRLISSASSSAAQLRSPGDEFRGRRKSSDLFYRHHRPLRCNSELHRRPQYVYRSHRDERRYPAQRQGLGGGWFPQQRSSRHAGEDG